MRGDEKDFGDEDIYVRMTMDNVDPDDVMEESTVVPPKQTLPAWAWAIFIVMWLLMIFALTCGRENYLKHYPYEQSNSSYTR